MSKHKKILKSHKIHKHILIKISCILRAVISDNWINRECSSKIFAFKVNITESNMINNMYWEWVLKIKMTVFITIGSIIIKRLDILYYLYENITYI